MKKKEEKTERNDNSSFFFLFNEFSHGWKRRGSRNNTQYASILLLSFSFALCRLQGPIFYFIIFGTALFFDWWREITVFFFVRVIRPFLHLFMARALLSRLSFSVTDYYRQRSNTYIIVMNSSLKCRFFLVVCGVIASNHVPLSLFLTFVGSY